MPPDIQTESAVYQPTVQNEHRWAQKTMNLLGYFVSLIWIMCLHVSDEGALIGVGLVTFTAWILAFW